MVKNIRKQNYPYPVNLIMDILHAQTPEEIWPEDMPEDIGDAVEFAMQSLIGREKCILLSRYREHRALADIGVSYGITGNRVRQVEVNALSKLRRRYPASCRLFTEGLAAYREYMDKKQCKDTHVEEGSGKERGKNITLEDLELPTRVYTRLRLSGFRYAGEVAEKSENQLKKLKGFGTKSCQAVQQALEAAGFLYDDV